MNTKEMIREKNSIILRLEGAKAAKLGRRTITELASIAASLESRIARSYLDSGRIEDAVVNVISEASCFVDAERPIEARKAWSRALALTSSDRLRKFVESQLSSTEPRSIESIFSQVTAHITNNESLRRPQREAYLAAQTHFANTLEHALVQLPVGCGKTGLMAVLPFGIAQGRVLVIAPNLEIHSNIYRKLDYTNPESFLRKHHVLENGSFPACSKLDTNAALSDADVADIVVSNIQQLAARGFNKWLAKFPDDYFDMILVDEGHHGPAASWQAVFSAFPKAKVTSFTATPIRADGQAVTGNRIYHFPIAQAIREGYVKDIASWRLDLAEIEFVYGGDNHRHTMEEVAKLREESWFRKGVALSQKCNEHIVDASIQAMRKLRSEGDVKHQIIAAACQIDHAKSIASLYRTRNVEADVIHSKMSEDDQNGVRSRLEDGTLDAIVHVGMLGEGADYPRLGVAAIFRPYAHVMPYIQFIGRVMRVNVANALGHPDNRGFIVSHPGLHVDRWWSELKKLDEEDEAFLRGVAESEGGFRFAAEQAQEDEGRSRRRYTPEMQVLNELVERFVEERFLPESESMRLDELIAAIEVRGYSLGELGLTRGDLERRVAEQMAKKEPKIEKLETQAVQPQKAREEARRRLDERAKSAAAELLNELGLRVNGRELHGSRPNLPAAIIRVNQGINARMGWGQQERDLALLEQLELAYNEIDAVIDELAQEYRARKRR